MISINNSIAQKIHNPKTLFDPTPYAFSHLVTVPPNAQLFFIAGQGGEENTEGKLSADFRKQVQHSLKNLKILLKHQGCEMGNIVKLTTLVVDHDDEKLQIIIEEFKKQWPNDKYPVNTLIPVPRLALNGMLVEIDAIAIKDRRLTK